MYLVWHRVLRKFEKKRDVRKRSFETGETDKSMPHMLRHLSEVKTSEEENEIAWLNSPLLVLFHLFRLLTVRSTNTLAVVLWS